MGPSSAGAVGWMQFIPDTGCDGEWTANGDGIADPWNPDDAFRSAARYLAAARGGPTSRAGSSPTTMPSGTSTTTCSWPPSSAATSPRPTWSSARPDGDGAQGRAGARCLAFRAARAAEAVEWESAARSSGSRPPPTTSTGSSLTACSRRKTRSRRRRRRGTALRQTGSAASWRRRRPHSRLPGAGPSRHRSRPPLPAVLRMPTRANGHASGSPAGLAWSPCRYRETTPGPPPTGKT